MAENDMKPANGEELTAGPAAENKKIAEYEAAAKQPTADEQLIAEKMTFGMTREQAIGVINRQREHDKAKMAASNNQPTGASNASVTTTSPKT